VRKEVEDVSGDYQQVKGEVEMCLKKSGESNGEKISCKVAEIIAPGNLEYE